MAEHRIVLDDPKEWDHTASKRQRLHCTGCDLSLKIVGRGVDETIEALTTAHEQRDQ